MNGLGIELKPLAPPRPEVDPFPLKIGGRGIGAELPTLPPLEPPLEGQSTGAPKPDEGPLAERPPPTPPLPELDPAHGSRLA